MLARVVRGGTIRVGDAIAALPASAPTFSNEWQDRVLHVARAVPEGCRIGYRQLAELAGVPTAYCRAFPRVLSSLPDRFADRVGSEGDEAEWRSWSGTELFAFEKTRTWSRSGVALRSG